MPFKTGFTILVENCYEHLLQEAFLDLHPLFPASPGPPPFTCTLREAVITCSCPSPPREGMGQVDCFCVPRAGHSVDVSKCLLTGAGD